MPPPTFTGFPLVVYTVLVIGSWLGAVAFSLLYGLLVRWYKSEDGIHIFCYSTAVALALTIPNLRLVFGDFAFRPTLVLICGSLLIVVIWWRMVLGVKSYLKYHRNKNKPEGEQ